MTEARIVLCTFPSQKSAAEITHALLEERLVACANILGEVRSIYRWRGETCDDTESIAMFKTTAQGFEALRERLVELHPYDCPEVLSLAVDAGSAPYLEWLMLAVGA